MDSRSPRKYTDIEFARPRANSARRPNQMGFLSTLDSTAPMMNNNILGTSAPTTSTPKVNPKSRPKKYALNSPSIIVRKNKNAKKKFFVFF